MIKAIQTRYTGRLFRSRLEARWAVMLDCLKVSWEYEYEGFVLGDGTKYLPDFWMPELLCYVEIKPFTASAMEKSCCSQLAIGSGCRVYLFDSGIFCPGDQHSSGLQAPGSMCFSPDGCPDVDYFWCQCIHCGEFGIEYQGRSDRLACKRRSINPCPKTPHGDRGVNYNSGPILVAYNAAMSARFEHGEQPNV